jgi:RNA binding exosome subunit
MNVDSTGTKYVRIMKQTAFWRELKRRRVRTMFNIWTQEFFFFSTPCVLNVDSTGTKYVRIMKQTAFWRELKRRRICSTMFNILTQEFFFILTHPVY